MPVWCLVSTHTNVKLLSKKCKMQWNLNQNIFKEMHLKILLVKWQPFWPDLDVLSTPVSANIPDAATSIPRVGLRNRQVKIR